MINDNRKPENGADGMSYPGLAEVINLNQSDAAVSSLAGGNRGIWTSRKRGQNGRFEIIPGWKAGRFDHSPLTILPIIILLEENSVAVAEFQSRIGQGILYSGTS